MSHHEEVPVGMSRRVVGACSDTEWVDASAHWARADEAMALAR